MGLLPTNYKQAVDTARVAHLGWVANLTTQYVIGHFLPKSNFAVNPGMLACAGLHAGFWYFIYKQPTDHTRVKVWNTGVSLIFNMIFFAISCMSIADTFRLMDIEKVMGPSIWEHGVRYMAYTQVVMDLACYALLLPAEISLALGLVKAKK